MPFFATQFNTIFLFNSITKIKQNKILTLIAIFTICGFVWSCEFASDNSTNPFNTYQLQDASIATHQDSVIDSMTTELYRLNPPFYLVTLQIKQSTFTLDIGEHIKNKANEIEVTLAVDKRFYDSVSVGQEISNEFKLGSMLFDGDFSKLKIRVARKQIVKAK